MKLSARGEYACLALIDLSKRFNQGYVKIENICDRNNIPRKFLEQILLVLNRAGYLSSKRGSSGGYMLKKNPSNICVAEIVRLMDGPLAPVGSASEHFFEHSPVENSEELLGLFRNVRNVVSDKLESVTFGDLL